jgi:soluble cytochrome b562
MPTEKKIGDNLISQIKKSAIDLEKFQVQLALGKAEAKDKFEELKKKFNGVVHSAKLKINAGKNKLDKVKTEFQELEVQLALGKANTIDAFNEQKKKIVRAVSVIEKRLETNSHADEIESKFRHAIEKFKIQMEVLRVHYELGKMEARDEFEYEKHKLTSMLAKMKTKFVGKKKNNTQTRQQRRDELKEAYKHLKKAIIN